MGVLLLPHYPEREIPRTITIEVSGQNSFKVTAGEVYADELCWDEMLGAIARLTLGLGCGYLKSREYWDSWRQRLDEMASRRESESIPL